MNKERKAGRRCAKTISWIMIVSTLAAIGGQFFVRTHKQPEYTYGKEALKGPGAGMPKTKDTSGNAPVNMPSGFNIPSWKDQPLLPPGNIPQIQMPKIKYTGPNQLHYYEQPEFVKDYFKNLTTNYPRNKYEQNCSYVAATMLLSYYDTYWNPNFIPDQYNNTDLTVLDSLSDKEFDSPGVKDIYEEVWNDCDPMDAPKDSSPDDYKKKYYDHYRDYINRMLEHKNESFVAYLYDKAIETGGLRPEVFPVPLAYLNVIQTIVNKYFSENPKLAGKVTMNYVNYRDLDGSTFEEKQERIVQLGAERLKKGQPIIFSGMLSSGFEHSSLAYDYDEHGRASFMVHLGWKDEATNYFKAYYRYRDIREFCYLDVSPELQTIPNNPRFQVNGTAYSCHDLSSFIHKEKAICYEDETYHAIQSSDRDLRYEKHDFVYISSDTKRCTICGKTISTPSWSN